MNYGFTKEDRLTKPVEYKRVFDFNSVVKNRQFVFFYAPNTLDKPRLGLAISKKSVRRAHERNRLKRLAREWFRLQKSSLPSVDIVVVARQSASGCDNAQIINSYSHLAGLIKKGLKLQQHRNISCGTLDG